LAAGAFEDAEPPMAPPAPVPTMSVAPGLADSPVGQAPADQMTPTIASAQANAETQSGAPISAATLAPLVQPPAVVEPFVLPLDSLQAVAESAGLQWVNSDADKIAAVREAMEKEPPVAHVPRERKALPVVDEGPLVLVETRKDLSQFKLPFDNAQGGGSHPVG
jgi:ribonuclease E